MILVIMLVTWHTYPNHEKFPSNDLLGSLCVGAGGLGKLLLGAGCTGSDSVTGRAAAAQYDAPVGDDGTVAGRIFALHQP
jgi:hypothetical protein